MSIRLPASKRNAIIADFTNGVNDPEYEVIPSKTIKGKYTVRKRKVEESGDQQAETPEPQQVVLHEVSGDQQAEEPQQEEEEDVVDDQTNSMFNPYAYFQEYQLQVNRLLIEQMKALRQNSKYMMKKQQKYKQRQKTIRNIFSEVANGDDDDAKVSGDQQAEPHPFQQVEERPPVQEKVTEEEEQHEVAPQELPPITSYYQNDYPQPQTNYQPPPRPLTPAPEPVQYQNDYEAKLDDMAGTYNFVSRRDRLKAFI